MTDEQKILAVAELDGIQWRPVTATPLPDYLNSIDAVREVVLKQNAEVRLQFDYNIRFRIIEVEDIYRLTARDWVDALLKAAGKLKE